ncbi:thrombospondin type 1 domain-containing protein, putative [Eimeria praecox]|uniref:Thrombospondin type 1 domain-containing protein, putative n=1 Tax=Eimeria praecox TaxID=51316 RepID=U6GVY3_9EIME|nr:thrombospondin type 1 domain-containing protein, putative [Eimeria praecox]
MLQLFITVALTLPIYCRADLVPDFVKGKIYLKGDGAWVRVDFPNSLINPLVFLGSPDYIGDYGIVPQVGEVDVNGFTARVMVPPCITADLSRTEIGVPYIVWCKTAGQDYFSDYAVLTGFLDSSTAQYHTYSFFAQDWDRISSDYTVLVQIQNMASIEENATEFNQTPYAHARGSVGSGGKKYFITLSSFIATNSPTVVVAIMALGATLPPNFGGADIELQAAALITSGNEFSHSLASPALAFMQPQDVSASYSYAVDCNTNSCVPWIVRDCQSSAALTDANSSYLLVAEAKSAPAVENMGPNCWNAQSASPDLLQISERPLSSPVEQYAFEKLITWSDTAIGGTWNTEEACGKGAVQFVQVLFSDEFVLNGMLPETPSCRTQDITEFMSNLCKGQESPVSGVCEVTNEAFADAALSSLCGTALNPSIFMRFNCDSCEFILNTKRATDGGPQCTSLSDQAVDTLEAAVCRNLCLDLWDLFKEEAMAQSSPYNTFVALVNQWHADNPWALPSSLSDIAINCTFDQRAVFDLEEGNFVVRDLCPTSHFADIAGALFGCKSMIVDGEEKSSCEAYDATSDLQRECASRSWAQCTVSESHFPSALELCQSCDTFSLVVFYSCKLRAESLTGYGISAHSLSGNIVYSGTIPSCACAEGSTPATQEEITVLSSWQASVIPPQSFVLANARGVYVDESGNMEFSIWAPSSEDDCLSEFVKILCKHPVMGDPDEGMMNPTPLCEEAFSTKTDKSVSHDELCRETCSHVLKNKCASAENRWACANDNVTDCYVPNSLRKTCGIMDASTEYNPKFGTCGCADDPTIEPCTETEVKILANDWMGLFNENYKGQTGVLLLRNMRVMEDSGSIYTDFGVSSDAACANVSEYKGIFCRVDADVTSAVQTGLQPNCDGAVSVNKPDISDYQCAYWCHDLHNNCKETQPSNASPCYFEMQKTHPILSHCSVPSELEDKEQGDSNMVAGTVTITTQWKFVNFQSPVSPNPVVFTGLLDPLDTFGQVQVTGVSKGGFYIRLALDHCRIGYSTAYAQVSWLAVSEDSFTMPTSNTSIRVATVDATVGENVDLLPGFKLRTSSPILLTQIQNTPSNLPMTDIPSITTLKLTSASATIIVNSTAVPESQATYTVGYLFMDAVSDSQCSLGCKTNNLTVETKTTDLKSGWFNTVAYSKELFGNRPPLIFGSVVVKRGNKPRMLVKDQVQTLSKKALWHPKLYSVSQESCTDFVFEEVSTFFPSVLLMVLHVKDHFTPNCAKAKSKSGSATDAECVAECVALSSACAPPLAWECFITSASEELKAKCYIEPSVDTAQTTTTTTTPPPVGASVQCRVVDMSTYPDMGWDVDAMSCSCPQGFSPCTQHQVDQDRAHWIQDVSPWGLICRTWDSVMPVARGFTQVASDMCTASSSLQWEQRELPLYSLDDVVLNGRINKSGYNQCVVDTPLVFCPSASLTTTTSTATPTWDWPQNADCLPGDWSEWGTGAPCVLEETVPCVFDKPIRCDSLCRHSEWTEWSSCSEKLLEFGFSPVTTSYREKLVSAEAGGACSALDLKEYDASRCNGEANNNLNTPETASALQISSTDDAVDKKEKWSEWSSCDAPCLLNGQKARRYRLSIQANSSATDEPVYHSCDDILPVHDVPEERQFCKEQCLKIIASCSKEAKLKGKTPLQCFADYVTENQPVGGKCTYTQKLVKETTKPTCFPSFSRMNNDESSEFRFLDPTTSSMQCLCLTPDSVPCTAKEVFESRHISLATTSSCPHQNTAGAIFGEGTPGTADSKLFFAAADSAKIFCPLSNSKSFQQQADAATYSVFKSAAEMNEYCANGLESQYELSASTPYDIDIDCTKLMPRTDSVSAEECEKNCTQIKKDCADSTVDYLSCIATRRETTGFNAQCATKGTVFAGRGIVFCKLVAKNCTYSEWGEWSACSATCRSGVGMEASVRIRTRQILEPSTIGGEPCRLGGTTSADKSVDAGTVQTESCSFQEICDNANAALTLSITPKPEPTHAQWSPDGLDTTTTTQSPVQVDPDIACGIYNMAGVTLTTRFDPTYRTCRCPSYTRPCTLAEAEASRSLWNQSMMALCQEDSVAVIPLTDFGLFDCETRTFKESVADFNSLTAEDQCSTDQFSSVFCVVADDVETERRNVMITMLITLLGGTFVGIAFVLWFIQHSVDVQKVLGLRGRYVELVNMVKE